MTSDFLRKSLMMGLMLALVGATAACGDDDDDGTAGDDDDDDMTMEDGGTDPGEGAVRVVHMSPTTGGVDVFVNGTATDITGATFPAATDFVTLPAGDYDFDVAPAGAGVEGAVISLADFAIADGANWTFVAWGEVAEGALPAIAIEEDFADLADGDIRLNIVHAAAGIPVVDVYAIAITEDTRLAAGIEPGANGTVDVTLADLPAGLEAVPVILDAGQDGTADATFNVPTSLLGGGAEFFNVYAVNTEAGPVLYAHTRADSATLAGPIAAN